MTDNDVGAREMQALYYLLNKAQAGFDMITDALEEKDYDLAMQIATKIRLVVDVGPTEKDITNES